MTSDRDDDGRIAGWKLVDRVYDSEDGTESLGIRVTRAAGEDADDGVIRAVYHDPAERRPAQDAPGVVWVGGIGGGLVGPADGMYPRLAETLRPEGVASLRVDYRRPRNLESCIADCMIGVGFLREEGVERVALVGHSSGGAVVIAAGALLERIVTVVVLATQTYGTQLASSLAPASLLLVHGTDDAVLPPTCSVQVEERANTRTELRLIRGAGHSFEGHEETVRGIVRDWLRDELAIDRT